MEIYGSNLVFRVHEKINNFHFETTKILYFCSNILFEFFKNIFLNGIKLDRLSSDTSNKLRDIFRIYNQGMQKGYQVHFFNCPVV